LPDRFQILSSLWIVLWPGFLNRATGKPAPPDEFDGHAVLSQTPIIERQKPRLAAARD
jgi:hypothetical protein